MYKKSKSLSVLVAVACAALLSACASSDQDIQRELQTSVASIKGAIPVLPVFKPYTATQYEVQGMPDPFGPVKAQLASGMGKKTDAGRPDSNRARQPLEAFALESMELNGTIIEKGMVHAMVAIQDNLYTVKVGDYIGLNFGRVVKIKDTEVILLERVQESTGEWTERENRISVGISAKATP